MSSSHGRCHGVGGVRIEDSYCPGAVEIQAREWLLGVPVEGITIESCVCWWEFLDAGPFLNTGSFVDAGPFLDAGPTEFLVFLRDGKALAAPGADPR